MTSSLNSNTSPVITKKRKATNENPDFENVLLECGVLSITEEDSSVAAAVNDDKHGSNPTGSVLDVNVTSLTLRASLNGLLQEMHRNGTDVDHLLTIQSMQEWISNAGHLRLFPMLLPMKISKEYDHEHPNITMNHTHNETHDHADATTTEVSLMKTLLRVEALQPALLTCLLQTLHEIATNDQDDFDPFNSVHEFQRAQEVRRLILSHIRWMEFIVDPSAFIESIMECIGTLPSCFTEPGHPPTGTSAPNKASSRHNHDPAARSILLDLMSILPDIIDDDAVSQNPNLMEEIISTLREVRNAHPSLLIPCLDTISSIRFTTPDQVKMVIEDALEALETVTESWLMPSLCKFLLQNTPRGDALLNGKVVDTLRRLKLGYENNETSDTTTTPKHPRFHIHGKTDSEGLMLEYIAQGMTYRSDLMTSLIHSIKCTIPNQHTAADIWLLFCCGNASHHRTKINQLFKSKAQSGGFTVDLMADAIHGNGIALQFLFESSIMPLADALLRSNDSYSQTLGCSLYEELYLEFIDRSQRQDIVGQIVIHISSGTLEEIDGAFNVLRNIISRPDGGPSSLRLYLPFLTSLLDNILNFEATHLRSLFLVLFLVQGERNDESSSGGDEMLNCIRKNLAYHQNLKHMHIAIIGAVSFAIAMGQSEDPEVESDIFDTLVMVHKSCSANCGAVMVVSNYLPGATAMSLFLDELAYAVQSRALSFRFKNWIIQSFSSTLEEYLDDIKADSTNEDGLSQICTQSIPNSIDRSLIDGTSNLSKAPKGEIRFNIDKEDALVYLRLLSVVCTKGSMLQQLCPLLRLLAVAYDERFGGEGINEIDAVLGCPILLPDLPSCSLEFTHLTEEQKITTMTCLFYAVAWCREIVNIFVFVAAFGSKVISSLTFDQDETRPKILKRLRCLLELEDELILCARKCHNFSPPGTISNGISIDSASHRDDNETENEDMDEKEYPRMTNEERRAFDEIKKLLKKKASEKAKLKQKTLRLKTKHEDMLENKVKDALLPMSPYAALALGFPELKDKGHSQSGEEDPIKKLFVCDTVSILLLQVLLDACDEMTQKRSRESFFLKLGCNSYNIRHKGNQDYIDSSIFDYLCTLIDGNVFVSIHERLVAFNEVFGDASSEIDDDDKQNMIHCVRLIFELTMKLVQSKPLSLSPKGMVYRTAILRQIACGDTISSENLTTKQSSSNILAPTKVLFDLYEEVFESCKAKDLEFCILFVNCLESLIKNVVRELDNRNESAISVSNKLNSKLSQRCLSLLRYQWPDGTKFNKRYVSILLDAYLQYSDQSLYDGNSFSFGHTAAINVLLNEAVMRLPMSDGCKGPVHGFSTCSRSTFGPFFTCILSAITTEANRLFSHEQLKLLEPSFILDALSSLIGFMNQTFKLTKENSVLAKSTYLLMQLKCGTKFMEVVIKKGLPIIGSVFDDQQSAVLLILRDLQRITRQMMFIIQHGKITKDGNVVREGPKVRKVCETFIHKVKVVMKKCGLEDAFTLGELKLKAIDGTVLEDNNTSDIDEEDDLDSVQTGISNTESEEE